VSWYVWMLGVVNSRHVARRDEHDGEYGLWDCQMYVLLVSRLVYRKSVSGG
jgi:hypothetical protein